MNKNYGSRFAQVALAFLAFGCSDGTGTDARSPKADVNVLPNDFVLKSTIGNGSGCGTILSTIPVGAKDTLVAAFGGVGWTWTSDDPAIVSVEGNGSAGVVTAHAIGQACITVSSTGGLGQGTVRVVSPVNVSISGSQNIALYQSAQYTASTWGGTTPYTYEWRSRDGSPSSWGSFTSWYSTGTTNYTYASISACGLDRKELQVRVTDAQSFTNTASYLIYITNPC